MNFTALLFALATFAYGTSLQPVCEETKVIKLTEDNMVSLRTVVSDESASKLISDLSKIKGDEVYIYLATPGGSITAGNHIIQHMNAMVADGKKVSCIAEYAFSMGFVIFQACPTRYVMNQTIIMQHQASLGVQGPIKQAANRFKLVEKLEKQSNEMQARRLGLTQQEFHDFYEHDGWLYGPEIVERNAGDEIVNVMCDLDTSKNEKVRVWTWFGPVDLEYSICPLIHSLRNWTFVKNEKSVDEKIANDLKTVLGHYDVSKFIDISKSIAEY